MPYYQYFCTKCDSSQEETASIKDDAFRRFEPSCEACGAVCKYRYVPTVPQIALKDGPSGSWPSKGVKYQKYRANRNEEMKRRQLDRYGAPKELISNYGGEITESWREAQNMAAQDKNKDDRIRAASVKSYEKRVKAEPKKITG